MNINLEVSRLKLFIEIFNAVQRDCGCVSETTLINELINTNHFTHEEAELYIEKALTNGQIYVRKRFLARP